MIGLNPPVTPGRSRRARERLDRSLGVGTGPLEGEVDREDDGIERGIGLAIGWRVEPGAGEEHVELVGQLVGEGRGGFERLARVGDWNGDPRVLELAQRLQGVLELRHDAEVPAAAAQRPQQLRIAAFAGPNDGAVGGDDLRADERVAGEPAGPHQVADPAGQRQAGDAGVDERAAGRREAVGQVVAVSRSSHWQPPWALATRRSGSTSTERMCRRSTTSASSATQCPATLWPPPRTAIGRPAARAARTAATTSSVERHWTMTAGRLSIIPLNDCRAVVVPVVRGQQHGSGDVLEAAGTVEHGHGFSFGVTPGDRSSCQRRSDDRLLPQHAHPWYQVTAIHRSVPSGASPTRARLAPTTPGANDACRSSRLSMAPPTSVA